MVDGVNLPELWQPFGPFSMAVIQGEGQIVHLKGQVALDPSGEIVGTGDLKVQLRQALGNIRTALGAMGGTMGDVVSLTHYTTDIEWFMECGEVRREFFKPPYPISTSVEVAALYNAELMIEISAVAEIPRDRFRRPAALAAQP
jgi:enamine deaminase RidA (YjgF/YER057c/UK114 family)